ncbi:MAG: hypothetical protein ACOCT0_05615 [Halobacteriota archaeon]
MRDRRDSKTVEITYRDQVGETDKSTFAKWMGIGATAMVLLLIATLSMGMIAGALGVGIGGFVASFGMVTADPVGNGDGGAIYPVLGEQPACSEAPQLKANLPGDSEITEHVAFYKDLPLPGEFANNDVARINIVSNNVSAGDVVLTDLDMRLSALEADELSMNASGNSSDDPIEIAESLQDDDGDAYDSYGVNGSPGNTQDLTSSDVLDEAEFGIGIPNGSNVTIDNGTAAAHQVSFTGVTLPDVDLFVTMGEDLEDLESETGVANRSVQSGVRDDCDNLADESVPSSYGGTYP